MSIVTTAEPAKKAAEYPKLMIAEDGEIVLFTQEGGGTVVGNASAPSLRTGHYSDGWSKDCFVDYDETVVLWNKRDQAQE